MFPLHEHECSTTQGNTLLTIHSLLCDITRVYDSLHHFNIGAPRSVDLARFRLTIVLIITHNQIKRFASLTVEVLV